MAYAVINTDLMSGTKQPADLVSMRFYDAEGKTAEVENGVIAELQGYEDGEREVMKAVAATSSSSLNNCAIIANWEVGYDNRILADDNLDKYINEAGKAIRGYVPRSRNIFGITKEGFVDGTVPAIGAKVGIGANGKIDASGSGLGECVDITDNGRYVYYAIRIAVTEA